MPPGRDPVADLPCACDDHAMCGLHHSESRRAQRAHEGWTERQTHRKQQQHRERKASKS
jgi:hypothetical protein